MKKNLTTRFKTKMSMIFAAMLMLAVSFSCTSIEEQPTLDENAIFKKAFLAELENIHSPTNPNARNGNALPSVQVTLAALRATDTWVPAVKDRATVFIATDEAYSAMGITSKNLNEIFIGEITNLMVVMAAVGNQVISNEKIVGSNLEGIEKTNLMGTILTVTKGDKGQLILNDAFGQSANIIRTDFKATNSVTHFIDKVLIPQLPPPPTE